MKEQIFDVNKLRVASPCPTNWESMHGNNKTRFCDLCNLNVYNFSEMSSEEIKNLIAEADGRICGKMYKRADGTILTQDCPVGLRAYYKRTARFAGAALTAILGLFSVSFGQSGNKDSSKTLPDAKETITKTADQTQFPLLSGKILDSAGAIVPDAEIKLRSKDGKTKLSTRSDANGDYRLPLKEDIYLIEVKLNGFKLHKVNNFVIKANEKNYLEVVLEPKGENGLIGIIISDSLLDTSSPTVTHRITREMLDRMYR